MPKNQLLLPSIVFLCAGIFFAYNIASAEIVEGQFSEGTLIRSEKSSIYYVGADKKLHPFLHPSIFHAWHDSFEKIQVVSDRSLRSFSIGEPVCVRSGTWLVKFHSVPRIYAVEPGCVIRPLRSETEATIFYGGEWQKRVIELDTLQSNFYTIRGFSAAEPKKGMIDNDGDGIALEMERDYGTSDGVEDYDSDKLSDYEEIYFWKTDPTKPDTDGDGKKDGAEIMNRESPTGSQSLTALPSNTYLFPRGAYGTSPLFYGQGKLVVPADPAVINVDVSKPTVTRQGQVVPL